MYRGSISKKMKTTDEKEDHAANHQFFVLFNNWRKMDLLSTIFGLIGLVVGICSYEYDISHGYVFVSQDDYEHKDDRSAMRAPRFTDPFTRALRWTIFLTSYTGVFFLVMRNYYKVLWVNNFFNQSVR